MTSKEKTRAMKKHATVMAAEAVAEEKARELAVARELVKRLEQEHSEARIAVREAQLLVDASLPQCRLVQVHWRSGKEANAGRVVILRKTPGGMLVVRRVGDSFSGAEFKFKWLEHSGKYVDSRKQHAYLSDLLELRDVPEVYAGPARAA